MVFCLYFSFELIFFVSIIYIKIFFKPKIFSQSILVIWASAILQHSLRWWVKKIHGALRALASRDAKKNLFYIIKHHFIYFTNSFYNWPYIPVFIFIYNSIKKYKLPNKIIKKYSMKSKSERKRERKCEIKILYFSLHLHDFKGLSCKIAVVGFLHPQC